jgi:hypothetical protein
MVKKIRILLPLLLCIILLTGCGTEETNPSAATDSPSSASDVTESTGEITLEQLRETIRSDGSMVGVAFIDYLGSGLKTEDLKVCLQDSAAAAVYPFLLDGTIAAENGTELYALVPAEETAVITVYPASQNSSGTYEADQENPVLCAEPGATVILYCNPGKFTTNVVVSVTDGDAVLEFSPMLSEENGRLAKADGCYDFSIYESTDEMDEDVYDCYQRLLAVDEVKNAVAQGMVLEYTGETLALDEVHHERLNGP